MSTMLARGRTRWLGFGVALTLALGLPVGVAGAQDPSMPWLNPSLSPDGRVALLLPQMTLEEKVDLMTGNAGLEGVVGFSNAAIPRLGIPALRMADAGSGLRRPPGTPAATAMPNPLALAATWDPEVGFRYGRLVADEAFQLRNNVVLGPNADLSRVPWWGRISESVGEDPALAARMTERIPAAVQRPGVLATYKHPLLYNQETNRGKGQNSIVDERTIREVYAPPFAAAIKGGVGSLMCSFNKINGEYACESDEMQNTLLREELGFKGFIMSDYLANHSTSPEKGLDMETPGLPVQPTYYGPLLLQAVQNGSVSMAVIDQACTRILWAMFKTGLFDNPLPATYQPIPYAEHSAVARQVEEQAITLLKNDRRRRAAGHGGPRARVLPLDPDRIDSIAVIGADTDRPARLGGSAFVTIPGASVGLLKGLTDRAPAGVEVRSAPGTDRIASGDGIFTGAQPLSSSVQSPPGSPGVPGVRTEFWANDSFSGAPIAVRTEPDVTFNIFRFNVYADIVRQGPPGDTRSLRSTSVLTVPRTGEYSFSLSGWGEGRLWIDGVERAAPRLPRDPGQRLHGPDYAGGRRAALHPRRLPGHRHRAVRRARDRRRAARLDAPGERVQPGHARGRRPGTGLRCPRGLCPDRRDRAARLRDPGAPAGPGHPDQGGRGGEPEHRRGARHGPAGPDAVGIEGRCRRAQLFRRPGAGFGARPRAVRRRQPVRQAPLHDGARRVAVRRDRRGQPGGNGGQPRCAIPGGPVPGLPGVRQGRPHAAVPVRSRVVVHDVQVRQGEGDAGFDGRYATDHGPVPADQHRRALGC